MTRASLIVLGSDNRDRCRTNRGKKSCGYDAGRVCAAGRRAERDHARRQQGDARGIDREEQRHRVRRDALMRIEAVELLHGADAERRRRVPEAEGIGRYIEDHRPHRGMVRRDFREQAHHGRSYGARDDGQQSARLCNLHQAEKQRHYAHQSDRKRDRRARRLDHPSGQLFHG